MKKIVGVWKMIFTPETYFQLGINSHTTKKYVSIGNKFPLCKNFRVPCQLHKVYLYPVLGRWQSAYEIHLLTKSNVYDFRRVGKYATQLEKTPG